MGGNRIYVVAADPSADLLGASLLREFRATGLDLHLAGAGGRAMQSMGISSPVDLSSMVTFGYLGALKAMPKVQGIVGELVAEITEFAPDVVVLIDNWSFTHRLAKALRRQLPDCKLVKYVAPQVFVSRAGRAREAAEVYDLMLTLHEFEVSHFTKFGLPTIAVGNPALFDRSAGDGHAFRERYSLGDAPILCVLFGSRVSEFNHLRGVFLSAIADLRDQMPDVCVVAPLAGNIATLVRVEAARDARLMDVMLVDEAEKADVLAASTASMACSGTVTLEAAQAGVPMVIAYKSDWLTAKIMLDWYKVRFANLINWSAGRHVIPELLQQHCTAESLLQSLLPLMSDTEVRQTQIEQVAHEIERMRCGNKKPSARAAEGILQLLQ